jgi:FKBP-type peptidyl-prolyl cis-trans isomerase SlyD
MEVKNNTVVSIQYTLTDDKADVVDSSTEADPLSYIQGAGQLLPAVEDALEGKSPGDSLRLELSPEEGYGLRDDSLVFVVSREKLDGVEETALGTRYRVKTRDGEKVLTLTEIGDKRVTLDGNHPLAGKRLHFDISVIEVRECTAEEMSHGHAHDSDQESS